MDLTSATTEPVTPLSGCLSDLDSNRTRLLQLNDQMVMRLLPAVIYLGVLMLVGAVGNALVLYVFGWRLKTTTQNVLFLWLAVFDLLTCLIGMPSEIVDMRHYYLYEDEAACKVMKFLLTVPPIASVNLLLIIAVDRYRRVCRPLHGQMTVGHARLCVVGSSLLAVVVAGPALSLYGRRTIHTDEPYLTGCDCSVQDKYQDHLYPLLYELAFGVVFIVYTVALAAMYIRVWLEIRRHRRYLKRHSFPSLVLTSLLRSDADNQPSALTDSPEVSRTARSCCTDSPDVCQKQTRRTETRLTDSPETFRTARSDCAEICQEQTRTTEVSLVDGSMLSRKEKRRHHEEKAKNGARFSSTGSVPTIISDNKQEVTHKQTSIVSAHAEGPRDESHDSSRGPSARIDSQSSLHRKSHSPSVGMRESPDTPEGFCQSTENAEEVQTADDPDVFRQSMESPEVFRQVTESVELSRRTKDRPEFFPEGSPKKSDSPRVLLQSTESPDVFPQVTESPECFRQSTESVEVLRRESEKKLKAKMVKALKANKLTFIALAVTLVFVVSYLPHLCLIILRTVKEDFDHLQTDARLASYNIFLRSYFVNSVGNVFVYSAMNTEFRAECKTVFTKLFCCAYQKHSQ